MRRVRRMSSDVHIEMTPMIDVVFLLLTFFIFAVVMMVRADVLDVNLPELAAGHAAERTIPITIVIDETGSLFVNSEPVGLASIIEHVQSLNEQIGDGSATTVVLAVDTKSPAGVMISLADALTSAGMGEFSIIGHRSEDADSAVPAHEQPESP